MLLLAGAMMAFAGEGVLVLPEGEDPASWRQASVLAGIDIGTCNPGDGCAHLLATNGRWRIVVEAPGGERSLAVKAPRGDGEREEIASLAASLLGELGQPAVEAMPSSAPLVTPGLRSATRTENTNRSSVAPVASFPAPNASSGPATTVALLSSVPTADPTTGSVENILLSSSSIADPTTDPAPNTLTVAAVAAPSPLLAAAPIALAPIALAPIALAPITVAPISPDASPDPIPASPPDPGASPDRLPATPPDPGTSAPNTSSAPGSNAAPSARKDSSARIDSTRIDGAWIEVYPAFSLRTGAAGGGRMGAGGGIRLGSFDLGGQLSWESPRLLENGDGNGTTTAADLAATVLWLPERKVAPLGGLSGGLSWRTFRDGGVVLDAFGVPFLEASLGVSFSLGEQLSVAPLVAGRLDLESTAVQRGDEEPVALGRLGTSVGVAIFGHIP